MEIINKKTIKTISKIFASVNLGEVEYVAECDSSQNIVYEVHVPNKVYILKEYSKDAIKDEEDLIDRKRQITVCEKMSKNGVPTILPLSFNGKYFIHYKNTYYLIYDFVDYESVSEKDLTLKKIKKLSNTLAIIHKLNIKCNLPCHYEIININFQKYLKKFKGKTYAMGLYDVLSKNIKELENLVAEVNENLKAAQKNLCISHNDYKLKNILWKKDFMYLLDFDACGQINPSASLAESAFALSKQGTKINFDFYKEFLKTYIKKYGKLETDYKIALSVCMNGKLQWLNYLLSKCTKSDIKTVEGATSMIKELVLFINNKEEFYKIYLDIVK